MIRKHYKFILTVILIATLALVMSGCGRGGQDLEGKNIVTFELCGGTLELKTSSVSSKINYAYEPGTYILDPSTIPGYKLYRQDYVFTGWYTTEECKETDKWNFKTPFTSETLTLYAGWVKAIKTTYTVNYVYNGEAIKLGVYDVAGGDTFSDWRNYASGRKDYTPTGYYSDITLTTPWDATFTHPGGETDTDVAVYVDYIEGNWKLVDTADKLKSALKSGDNVYLLNDIDLEGSLLIDPDITTSYIGVFEGNGYTVSNFTVKKVGSLRPSISIFGTLKESSEVRNVNFTNVAYDLTGIGSNVNKISVGLIATDALGAKIENVTVSGTLTTNYEGELGSSYKAVSSEDANVVVSGFTANITVDIKK